MVMATIYNDVLLNDVISNDLERHYSKIFNDKRDAARVALNLHWLPVESRILQYFDLQFFDIFSVLVEFEG